MSHKVPDKRRLYLRQYQNEWMRKRRQAYFSDKSCVVCGSTDRLELDHRDPKQKLTHAIWSWSSERREAELTKCQPLCHECHKTKTLEVDRYRAPHGSPSRFRAGCRCESCRSANNEYQEKYRSRAKNRRLVYGLLNLWKVSGWSRTLF